MQSILEEKRDQSLQHILSGFMAGNAPEFILHGANTYILGSLLEKSADQPFPPGFCDPKLKFESALRLLNAEMRSPGLLNKNVNIE